MKSQPKCRKAATLCAIFLGLGTILLTTAGPQPFAASASPCDSAAVTTARTLGQLLAVPSPWLSVDPSQLRFVLVADSGDTYAFGFTEGQLLAAGAPATQCIEHSGLFKAALSFKLKGGNYDFAEPAGWDIGSQPSPFVSKEPLVVQAGVPIVIMKTTIALPPNADLPPMTEVIARSAIHELFHRYQGNTFRNMESAPGRDLGGCYAIPSWKTDLLSEFATWDSLVARIENTTQADLANTVTEILAQRTKINITAAESACWQQVEAWERIEGLAHYYEVMTSSKALGQKPDETWIFMGRALSSGAFDEHQFSQEFYYITGGRQARILQRLDPSGSWQKLAEEGLTPSDILRKLLRERSWR